MGRLQATKFKEKDSQYERQREPKKGSREREDASQLESLHGGLFQQDGVVCPPNARDQQHHLPR